MGLEFLARVRRTSTWLGGVVTLMAATYVRPMLGLAFAAGVLWSLVNLQLLERLVVSLAGEKRGTPANVRRLAAALLGMPVLFGAGWVLLEFLSPAALLAGFLLPLAVIVAKAGTRVLLGSHAWRALLTHRFRAAFAALALAAATWFALGALTSAGSATAPGEHAAASAQATEHSDRATAAPAEGSGNATDERSESNEKEEGFANVIGLIVGANPHAAWAHFLEHWEV